MDKDSLNLGISNKAAISTAADVSTLLPVCKAQVHAWKDPARLRPHVFVRMGCHQNRGNRMVRRDWILMKLEPGHLGHAHVRDSGPARRERPSDASKRLIDRASARECNVPG